MSRSVEYISSTFAKLMHNNDDAVKYMYEKQNALMTHYFALGEREYLANLVLVTQMKKLEQSCLMQGQLGH